MMKKVVATIVAICAVLSFFAFKKGFFENGLVLEPDEIFHISSGDSGQVQGIEKEKVDYSQLRSQFLPVEYVGLVPQKADRSGSFYAQAHSSVALDVDSGTILFYQNGKKQSQVASLTKIMTAILAVENIDDFDDPVTITEDAIRVPGTRVGCPNTGFCNGERLKVGEKVRARDLLKAMLINSTNDAATALGIHIGGSEEKFAELMNKRAKELGLSDTNFCRPSGLEYDGKESECYSTAYDMARLVAYSLKYDKYEIIWDYFKIREADFNSLNGQYTHHIGNTNKALDTMPSCLGAKTGFTPLAGLSLFMAVESPQGKNPVVMVFLDDPYRFDDARLLSEWIYSNYEWK